MGEALASGRLVDDGVLVSGVDGNRIWNLGYYGEFGEGGLFLSPVEALFLVDRGKLNVFLGDVVLSFRELLQYFLRSDALIWLKYVIYSDLRRRGYVVKGGFSEVSFRVYERGAVIGEESSKFLVFGAVEGQSLGLSDLSDMVLLARDSRKELILAIVDRQDEVTYYDVNEVVL